MIDQFRWSSRSVCANVAEAWRKRHYPAALVISKLSDAEGIFEKLTGPAIFRGESGLGHVSRPKHGGDAGGCWFLQLGVRLWQRLVEY